MSHFFGPVSGNLYAFATVKDPKGGFRYQELGVWVVVFFFMVPPAPFCQWGGIVSSFRVHKFLDFRSA